MQLVGCISTASEHPESKLEDEFYIAVAAFAIFSATLAGTFQGSRAQTVKVHTACFLSVSALLYVDLLSELKSCRPYMGQCSSHMEFFSGRGSVYGQKGDD